MAYCAYWIDWSTAVSREFPHPIWQRAALRRGVGPQMQGGEWLQYEAQGHYPQLDAGNPAP